MGGKVRGGGGEIKKNGFRPRRPRKIFRAFGPIILSRKICFDFVEMLVLEQDRGPRAFGEGKSRQRDPERETQDDAKSSKNRFKKLMEFLIEKDVAVTSTLTVFEPYTNREVVLGGGLDFVAKRL